MAGGASSYTTPLVAVRSYRQASASDAHDGYHQIALGIAGSLEVEIERCGFCVAPNEGMIVPVEARHDYFGVGDNRLLIVDVPVDALTLPRQLFDRPSRFPIDARLAQWVSTTLARLPEHADRFVHWQASAHLCDVVLERVAGAGHVNTDRFTLPRIDAFLRAHLPEPLSIPALASFCGCSVRSFHDRFVAEFGITPHRYLLRLRVEHAARMMNARERSLADIAASCGFADQSALTHAFSARFGVTPGKWRNTDMSLIGSRVVDTPFSDHADSV